MNHKYIFKYILLGDMNTGKSSLIYKFIHGEQMKYNIYSPTIGVDYDYKTINVDGAPIKVQIWDTAGQEKFKSIISSYYKNISCAIIVYDVNNRSSFYDIQKWIDDVIYTNEDQRFAFVIIGTKNDLANREVTYEEGKRFADSKSILFFETNQTADIEQIFVNITKYIYKMVINDSLVVDHTDLYNFIDMHDLQTTGADKGCCVIL
ncbi:MAG: Ras-related protein Rab-2 [Faunusvirus sp.]|jgi:small GTP-binding protein|uniref:Ras-related protein Rab-2 n=1 Tax=Faunusvirus sp. TaxID=2487766 RepID=A0A3G4ZW71_9VIRU|nr:MAG: Ras-related protein Rab-2 [Faunusvirus sp.]